mgnify:CR=1 FL=1
MARCIRFSLALVWAITLLSSDFARPLTAQEFRIETVDAAALARFLPVWQGADRPRGDVDALADAVGCRD